MIRCHRTWFSISRANRTRPLRADCPAESFAAQRDWDFSLLSRSLNRELHAVYIIEKLFGCAVVKLNRERDYALQRVVVDDGDWMPFSRIVGISVDAQM